MCGISGFIDNNKKSSKEDLIKMTDALIHRGPDDSGYEFWQNDMAQIGLGHRRLSIIDLSLLGHQPMYFNEWTIVFNGEIYNYREIRKDLKILGYIFSSDTDTEVILKSFDKWGIESVSKFIGMFAFVIYNNKTQRVYCFRDRAGIKPFYYYWYEGLFLFSSELKSFHQHHQFKKKLNINAVAQFLQHGYIKAPLSIFDNSYKLLPGHFLILDLKNETLEKICYWNVYDYYKKPTLKINQEDAIIETERLLQSACEYRMVADVPIGVFLSGGYDSSAVTALLQKNRTSKIKTFTIGFSEATFNEAKYAKLVANYLGTDHTEYYCTAAESKSIISELAYYYDEPFADSSAIPTILISRLARQNVTVALSADAGDEIFAGYDTYSHLLKLNSTLSKIPKVVRQIATHLLKTIQSPEKIPFNTTIHNFSTRFDKIKNILPLSSLAEHRIALSQIWTNTELNLLIRTSWKEQSSFAEINIVQYNLGNTLNMLLAADYQSYMVDDVLTKVDRATMSVGLEGREPFLDHRIIEWVAQLPEQYKYNKGIKKFILKEIVHNYLPKEMMDRPKMGFSIPLNEWFRGDLNFYINEYLSKERIEREGIFNYEIIEQVKNQFNKNSSANIQQLWFLLMFEMWYEQWMK